MKSVSLSDKQIARFLTVTKNLKHEEPHQYEHIRIKDGKVIFILYTSNKLVYNENKRNLELLDLILNVDDEEDDSDYGYDSSGYESIDDDYDFIGEDFELLEDMDFDYSREYMLNNKDYYFTQLYTEKYEKSLLKYQFTIGSDESGKGEWYGPLIISAVCTSNEENSKLKEIGVADSKKIKREDITKIYEKIEKLNIKHETIILKPAQYNKQYNKFQEEGKNLNHMLAYLHSKAITSLLEKIDTTNVIVIIDKFDEKKMNEELNIDPEIEVIQENNGERYIPVATSSIIAKYYFEKTLKEIDEKYNIKLRETIPYRIDKNILDKVSKTHFKNVKRFIK